MPATSVEVNTGKFNRVESAYNEVVRARELVGYIQEFFIGIIFEQQGKIYL